MIKTMNTTSKIKNQQSTIDIEGLLFKYIKPTDNDILSSLNGFDLQDLIILIDNYYLKLREKLNLEDDITFGLELEFENAMKKKIKKRLNKIFPNNEWSATEDGSLHYGIEIKSPILTDTKENWKDLNKVCRIAKSLATIDKKSGGHIHVGAHILGDNPTSWLNFIKLWSVYENIIFRFSYGQFLTARPCIKHYAIPSASLFWQDYTSLSKENANTSTIITKIYHSCRYQAVNFDNIVEHMQLHNINKPYPYNTIEFRCPNGSLNPIIWQNNVNLFTKLLIYSKSLKYNDDIIQQRRLINQDKYSDLKWYDEIYLSQALELSDMIFTNNLDKIYFLRQYLKSFQINDYSREYPQTIAKSLTKSKTI